MPTKSSPQIPFIWSRSDQICGELLEYLTTDKQRLFVVICELDERSTTELTHAMRNHGCFTAATFIIVVYPNCVTRSIDLDCLRQLQHELVLERAIDIEFRVLLVDQYNEIPVATLLSMSEEQHDALLMVGSSSTLNVGESGGLDFNLISSSPKKLSRQYLEWFKKIWDESVMLDEHTVQLPELAVGNPDPRYNAEWANYKETCASAASSERHDQARSQYDPSDENSYRGSDTTSEKSDSDSNRGAGTAGHKSAGERFTMPEPDELSDRVNELIARGRQVMIAHSTAIPPLDCPVDPRLFNQERERSYRSITQRQAFRMSILSPNQLKEINDYRKASQTIVAKLGLSLEQSVYWMPNEVISYLEDEMKAREECAKELLKGIVGDDLEEFIAKNRSGVKKDFEAAYRKINKTRTVPSHLFAELMSQLRSRIQVAMEKPIITRVTYSNVRFNFDRTSEFEAPWAQIEKLLLGLAKFPRMNMPRLNSLSFSAIDPEKLLNAMDVANDNILKIWRENRERATRRARAELNVVKWIEDADIGNRQRCEACFRLMRGDQSMDILEFVEDNCNSG